jgi:glycosyltransferase involved in cell wall biosynthesis
VRILFLTQVLPFPLDAGPKIRAYYVMRYLAEAGHQVRLLSFIRPGESDEHVAPLRRFCDSVETVGLTRSLPRDLFDGVRSLWTNTPFLVLRDDLAVMRRRVRSIVQSASFDALHADQLWMAPYGLDDDLPVGRTVLDQHNAVFLVPRRLAEQHSSRVARGLLNHEAAKLQAFERDACRRYDRVVWVTEEDRRAVLRSCDERPESETVIPIATDPAERRRVARPRPFRITFLGGLHWPPNREGAAWFLERVWPRVARAAPSAVLTVIGKRGEAALPGAAGQGRVEVTGYVSDPSRYLAETAVFIVPLRSGAGMRVKILDAWCWGLPIVSTTVGAEGLRAVDGDNLLIADQDDVFADAVVRLLRNRRTAEHLADGGRATVEKFYDWATLYPAWDRVYERSAERATAPSEAGTATEANAQVPDRHAWSVASHAS